MSPSSLTRRLGAILYDFLLLFGLGALTTTLFVIVRGGESVEPGNLPHQLTLLIVFYAFFVGFWTKSGSTLGMLAWGLRVEGANQQLPTVSEATIRFFVAIISWIPAGLGFLWQLWDKDRCTWHDRASDTRLMYYPKNKRSADTPQSDDGGEQQ